MSVRTLWLGRFWGGGVGLGDPGSMRGQRILVAAEYINHGGTRTYFRELLAFYAEAGADVVALTTFERPDLDMRRFMSDLSVELFTFEEAVNSFGAPGQEARPAVWNQRLVAREVDLFGRMCDALGVQRVVLSVGTSGLFLSAANVRPKPLMIAHGYPHGRRQRILGRRLLGKWLPPDLKIVTVSDYSGALFRQVWKTDHRGIDVRTVRSTCGPLPPAQVLTLRDPLVITAALLEPYKEPFHWINVAQHVLRSMPESVGAQFMWMGDGKLLNSARDRVGDDDQADIHFPGWVDKTEIVYEKSRVYMQSSSKESLGLSVVDALRHSLPSVVTNVGGLPEVVHDTVNGFVVPVGDTQAAADAVRELLLDDHLWIKMSRAARELYEERFSLEAWKQALMAAHL